MSNSIGYFMCEILFDKFLRIVNVQKRFIRIEI